MKKRAKDASLGATLDRGLCWTGGDGYHHRGRLCNTKPIVRGYAGSGVMAIIIRGILRGRHFPATSF
eukprot:2148575-Rhodomonas_salina.1